MIKNFRELLDDRRRIEAFRGAISEVVDSSVSVAEIGSALGTYSFFAAQAGAKSVYAIEMADIYYVGKQIAKDNDLSDKIKFFHKKSTEVELPERVDFIIMEDYCPIFFFKGIEKVLVDARTRFLKENGRFIPNTIILKIAPVQCPKLYKSLNLWDKEQDELFGVNWEYTTDLIFSQSHYAENFPKNLLAEESIIKEFDLSKDSNFPYKFSNEFEISEKGTIHGLLCWWDCWFTPSRFFSNSPNEPSNTWGQMMFPFRYPVNVKKGDRILAGLQCFESKYSGEIDYKWSIEHKSSVQEQNTFQGNILPLSKMKYFDKTHEPRLNLNGEATKYLLGQIDEKITVEELAKRMVERFPKQFSDINDGYSRIHEIINRFVQ